MLDVQAAWIGWKAPEKVQVDQLLREGDSIRWGPFEAQVLHTPGHTQGSICLYMPSDIPEARAAAVAAKSTERLPGRLFAGDTLVCRKHRPHRPLGRLVRIDHRFAEGQGARTARRYACVPRARGSHHNRPGARDKSISDRELTDFQNVLFGCGTYFYAERFK